MYVLMYIFINTGVIFYVQISYIYIHILSILYHTTHTEARSPSVKKFREHIMTVLNDKHQTVITKTGAILAAGIIDAGM